MATTIPGIDHFCNDKYSNLKKGKFTLLTNPSGINLSFKSTIDVLRKQLNLVSLLGPEHGVRGDLEAGENLNDYFDERYGLPVCSLYNQDTSEKIRIRKDPDLKMRSFDTIREGKFISDREIKRIDKVVVDIQDIGTRIYTYLSSVVYLLEKCIEFDKELIILDRPNPISGIKLDGPVLEYPEFSSFIGVYALPMRHGMTLGELIKFINKKLFNGRGHLTIVPVVNWKRNEWFDQTGLQWINPSPNMPSLKTATVYPGSVLFEGTNISEGRGTTRPFEYIGAPWIDPELLSEELNGKIIPGVFFKEIFFKPTYSKFRERVCGGVFTIVTDRDKFKPFFTALSVISGILKLYPDRLEFFSDYFDKVAGNSIIRKSLIEGKTPQDIEQNYISDLNDFRTEREEFLIY